MTMIEIEFDEFLLIKKFHSDFTRAKGIRSNKYLISWNELMPLVEKIESLGYYVNNYNLRGDGQHVVIITARNQECISSIFEKTKINSYYKAVIEFIKWYNQNKLA